MSHFGAQQPSFAPGTDSAKIRRGSGALARSDSPGRSRCRPDQQKYPACTGDGGAANRFVTRPAGRCSRSRSRRRSRLSGASAGGWWGRNTHRRVPSAAATSQEPRIVGNNGIGGRKRGIALRVRPRQVADIAPRQTARSRQSRFPPAPDHPPRVPAAAGVAPISVMGCGPALDSPTAPGAGAAPDAAIGCEPQPLAPRPPVRSRTP